MTFSPYKKGERARLAIMGLDYATLTIDNAEIGLTLNQIECINADKRTSEKINSSTSFLQNTIFIRVKVSKSKAMNKDGITDPKANCSFSYSRDGKVFQLVKNLQSVKDIGLKPKSGFSAHVRSR